MGPALPAPARLPPVGRAWCHWSVHCSSRLEQWDLLHGWRETGTALGRDVVCSDGLARGGGGSSSVSLGLPEKPSGMRFSRIYLLRRGESLGYPQTICGEFETVDRKAPVLPLPIGMQDLGFRWPLPGWM